VERSEALTAGRGLVTCNIVGALLTWCSQIH